MNRIIYIFGVILLLELTSLASAQSHIVSSHHKNIFHKLLPDTLVLTFHENSVEVSNPHLEYMEVNTQETTVNIRTFAKRPLVCMAKGTCSNGRILIDADTTCTLLFSNLQLSSKEGSVIYLKQKQKAEIVLDEGTMNILNDAQKYNISDSTDTTSGCIHTKGSITFAGTGTLNISGNYRHAIASDKSITIEDGNINIIDTQKDGIHCDKYKQNGGNVNLLLSKKATKGIKTKNEFEMLGGRIEGEAVGDLNIDDGETSYCTLIKSDGVFTITDGEIKLKHFGKSGRCISVDKKMKIIGGIIDLECHGDGGSYLTVANDFDYYTPKCITVDDSLCINGGTVNCTSTGLGGKGIVADKYLSIGIEGEQNEPFLRVETKGECVINNEDEDQRFGCPKGIKANEELHIFSGNIAVNTTGMGGEGVECNGDMYIHGGTLECNTFDDGINVGHSLEISGGMIYCNSVDNDGIDSNGSIIISKGIVASISQRKPNQSFDSRNTHLYLYGGAIFGIGNRPVEIGDAKVPFYNTSNSFSEEGNTSQGLSLKSGKYVYLQNCNEIVFALRNENQERRVFLTITDPNNIGNQTYTIAYGDCPLGEYESLFDGKYIVGGIPFNSFPIIDVQM